MDAKCAYIGEGDSISLYLYNNTQITLNVDGEAYLYKGSATGNIVKTFTNADNSYTVLNDETVLFKNDNSFNKITFSTNDTSA